MAATLQTRRKKKPGTKPTIHPLDNRVLIRRDAPEAQSSGGIVLPQQAQENQQYGIVLVTGPGKLLPDGSRAAMSVKPGDRVVFGRYSEQDIQLNCQLNCGQRDDILILVREEDIYAVIGQG